MARGLGLLALAGTAMRARRLQRRPGRAMALIGMTLAFAAFSWLRQRGRDQARRAQMRARPAR